MEFSDRNCREFVKQLPEAVFLETLEGEILDVNREACSLLGYRKEELLDLEVEDLVPEGAPAFLPDEIDNATRSGEPLETANLHKDGTEIPIELRGKIVEIDGEKRMLVSVRDITGRKRFEEQLKHYKMAVEGSDDLMAACDKNYNYLFANNAYAELYQQNKDNIATKNVAEVVGEEIFEDEVKPRIDKCLRGERTEYEMSRFHPLLGERKLKVVYYPLREDGKTHGIVGVLSDITEVKEIERQLHEANDRLRQSRERYKRYFDKLGDAVFITKVGGEDHGSIMDANSAAEEQTGYPLNELIGMNIATDFPVGTPEELSNEEIDNRLSEGETVSFTERKRRKDGKVYWTEVIVNPIEHEGKPATLSINRDITDRKAYEKRLRAVEELSQKIKLTDSKDQLYDFVLDNVEETLGYGTVSICEKRDDAMKIVRIKGPYLSQSKGRELPLDGKGLIPAACRKCEPVYVEDVTKDERYVKGTESPGSEYVIPLQVEGELYGALDFENEEKAAFDEKDRDLMDILGSQIAVALQGIQRLKLYDEQRKKLKNLHDAVDRLQQIDDEESVLETTISVAQNILGFDICGITLLEGKYLVPKVSSARLNPEDSSRFKIGEGIVGKSFQEQRTIWGDDIRKFPEAKPTMESLRAFICVPIGRIGSIQVISEESGKFDEHDVELVEVLAGHLREELRRVRLEEELRQQVIHDPLTGLYNRRYFSETLVNEVERCERYGHNLAFIMIDVDRFKEVNDTYSHQTGDKILQEVAALLQENVRDADTVVRYGGDEFLVMMPETNGDSNSTIDRLKSKLDKWNEESDILDFPLTLAMGTSHWNPDQGRSVESALNEADHNMYEEKGN